MAVPRGNTATDKITDKDILALEDPSDASLSSESDDGKGTPTSRKSSANLEPIKPLGPCQSKGAQQLVQQDNSS